MQSGRWNLLAVMALWLLATGGGCTPWREYFANGFKVGPNYKTPPAAVAEHWIDAADQRIETIEPDLTHWWTVFNDPELNQLVHAAYRQNLTLREAGYRVLQARYSLAIQIGNLYPQQQYMFGAYERTAISGLVANRQFLPQRFYDQNTLGFNLAWELDFWGRFRRAIESADDQLDASVFNYDDVLVTLLGDVAATYVEMRTIQQQIQYVRENVKIQQTALDIAKARFEGGLTSDLDVEQAASTLAQTEALIPQFQIRLREAANRLCVLLGIPSEDITTKLGLAPIPTAPPEVAVGIPASLLTRRPDVRRAERLAAAQCAEIGIAETELYPQISINGTIGVEAEQINDLFDDQALMGAIGPGFRWNLLNYGRLVNNVRLQDARFQELVTTYQNTVLVANSEVENGLVEFLQSQLREKALLRSVTAATKAVQIAIVQYKNGLVDFNRVALLEQNLVQQQDLYAQAQGDIALGLVQIYRALGGGWQIRCQPSAALPPLGMVEVDEAIDGQGAEAIPPGRSAPQTLPTPAVPTPVVPGQPELQLPGPTGEPLLPGPSSRRSPPGQDLTAQRQSPTYEVFFGSSGSAATTPLPPTTPMGTVQR